MDCSIPIMEHMNFSLEECMLSFCLDVFFPQDRVSLSSPGCIGMLTSNLEIVLPLPPKC